MKKVDRLKSIPVTEHATLGDLLREVLKVEPPKKKAARKKVAPKKRKK